MKKIFTFLAVATFTMSLSAQHGSSFTYHYNDVDSNYGYHNTSNDYDYSDDSRYNDDNYRGRGSERYERGGLDNDRRRRYKRKRYRIRFENLSLRDQRRIVKLERKYERKERRAWGDGHLSRREKRQLRNIQIEIDRIWARYERYRNDRRGNYGSCG